MYSPTYVTNITDATQLKSVLKSHIDAVMGRYASDLYAFDVINERESTLILALIGHITDCLSALNENGTIKSSVWYNVLGEDYLGIAVNSLPSTMLPLFSELIIQLDLARAAAPNVKLYINDYNIESVNNKSLALVQIAKNLLAAGHPLDGIGFESHFIGGQVPKDLAQSMKMFTDLGLDVAITELDVRVPVNNQGIANSTWLDIQ